LSRVKYCTLELKNNVKTMLE